MSSDFEFQRRSIRLSNYDYSQSGMYFVTICTQERESKFGEIVDGVMVLNNVGVMVKNIWCEMPQHFRNIGLDEYQIMPDHFHGIIVINEMPNTIPNIFQNPVGAGLVSAHIPNEVSAHIPNEVPPNEGQPQDMEGQPQGLAPTGTSLADVVCRFKSSTTTAYINGVKNHNWPRFHGKLWQRNYYEHIIRDDVDLYFVREYIVNNPLAKTISDDAD